MSALSKEMFGELRRWMQKPFWIEEDEDLFEIWSLLEQMNEEDEDEYRDVWLPYLDGFRDKMGQYSLQRVDDTDMDEISEFVELLPIPCFELVLSGYDFSEENVARLRQTESLSFVRKLSFEFCELDLDDIQLLSGGCILRNVTALGIYPGCVWSDGVFECLVHALPQPLSQLSFNGDELDEAIESFLIQSPTCHNLHTLVIEDMEVSDNTLIKLSQSPVFKTVRVLSFAKGEVITDWEPDDFGVKGLKSFVTSPYISNITSLDLSGRALNMANMTLLIDAPFNALQSLRLNNCSIDDAGLVALLNSSALNAVTSLHLKSNEITDVGIKALVESSCLSKINGFSIMGPHVTQEGIDILLSSGLCEDAKKFLQSDFDDFDEYDFDEYDFDEYE